eukprot:1141106-Pelagomonas_calceolata.AAC.3
MKVGKCLNFRANKLGRSDVLAWVRALSSRQARRWKGLASRLTQGKAVWSNSTSPVCDICDSDDIQDENMCCLDVPIPKSALSVRSLITGLSVSAQVPLQRDIAT